MSKFIGNSPIISAFPITCLPATTVNSSPAQISSLMNLPTPCKTYGDHSKLQKSRQHFPRHSFNFRLLVDRRTTFNSATLASSSGLCTNHASRAFHSATFASKTYYWTPNPHFELYHSSPTTTSKVYPCLSQRSISVLLSL